MKESLTRFLGLAEVILAGVLLAAGFAGCSADSASPPPGGGGSRTGGTGGTDPTGGPDASTGKGASGGTGGNPGSGGSAGSTGTGGSPGNSGAAGTSGGAGTGGATGIGGSAGSTAGTGGTSGSAGAGGAGTGGTAGARDAGSAGNGGGVIDAGSGGSAGRLDGGPSDAGGRPFVHPGVIVNKGMLDFVKAKIAAGAEPWKTALARATSHAYGSKSYVPHPFVTINGSSSNGNWELSMIEAVIQIGVFNDDRTTFDKGVTMWRQRTPAYVYIASDGPTPVPPPRGGQTGAALISFWYGQSTMMDGLSQETCRDLGHVQYGLAAMVNAAETAVIQGVDLYAEQADRIATGLEFHSKFINCAAVPANLCTGTLTAVSAIPMWEIGYNVYATRLGRALPETLKVVQAIRPTSVDHHMVWETLTHAGIGNAGL